MFVVGDLVLKTTDNFTILYFTTLKPKGSSRHCPKVTLPPVSLWRPQSHLSLPTFLHSLAQQTFEPIEIITFTTSTSNPHKPPNSICVISVGIKSCRLPHLQKPENSKLHSPTNLICLIPSIILEC